jgi:hypothetical protein
MDISSILRLTGKRITENSPTILASTAVAGVVGTAVLAAKGGMKAAPVLEERYQETRLSEFNKREQFIDSVKTVWKFYIPAAISGGATIAAIVSGNHISARRNAALLSLYTISETAFQQYKDKVVETIGDRKEQKVRDEIAQEQVAANPASNGQVFITGKGVNPCYESWTGRYFESDMESLRRAENSLNKLILDNMYASLNDFFELIGLPRTSYGEEVGWNLDHLMEIAYSSVLAEDGTPCISIGYKILPKADYTKVF